MPATLENIKGRDLPPAWRRTAQVKDDEIVSVTITPRPTRSKKAIDKAAIQALVVQLREHLGDGQTLAGFNDEFYDDFGLPK